STTRSSTTRLWTHPMRHRLRRWFGESFPGVGDRLHDHPHISRDGLALGQVRKHLDKRLPERGLDVDWIGPRREDFHGDERSADRCRLEARALNEIGKT